MLLRCCCCLENNTIKSSTEKQSSAIIVHEPKRTATSTRTIHTRQNKPYRLGAAPAGVVGARGRCCPAATVPVAVVFPCCVCCCIAENIQIKPSTEKQSSAIIVHEAKRTATSTRTTHTRQNKPFEAAAVQQRRCPQLSSSFCGVSSGTHLVRRRNEYE